MKTYRRAYGTGILFAGALLLGAQSLPASGVHRHLPAPRSARHAARSHSHRFRRVKRRLTITGYCIGPCRRCETCGLTRSGTHCVHGVAVARRAWLRALPLGARVYIPEYGWARIDDVGGKVRSNQLDLRFANHRVARHWGKREMTVLAVWPVDGSG